MYFRGRRTRKSKGIYTGAFESHTLEYLARIVSYWNEIGFSRKGIPKYTSP